MIFMSVRIYLNIGFRFLQSAPTIRNNYGAIKLFFYRNIGLMFQVKILLLFFFAFLVSVLCFFSLLLFLKLSPCDSDKFEVIFVIAFKRERESCWNSLKSNNFIGSNLEKKPWTNIQNWYVKEAKSLRVTTFAITKLGER